MHVLKKLLEKKGFYLGLKLTVSGLLLVSIIALQGCRHYFKEEQHFDMADAIKAENVMPVVIIGSGPAGLSAAGNTVLGLLPTVVFEGPMPGGLLTKTTEVDNVLGFVGMTGPQIIEKMRNDLLSLGAKYKVPLHIVSDSVVSIDCSVWPFVLKTEGDITVRALSVVIATGATPRMLGVPGEKEYWGYGVTSCAICDAPFFGGEDVVVVGGGDSAVEESLQAAQWVKSVKTLVRTDRMRAAESGQKRLSTYPSIEVVYNKKIESIEGEPVTTVTHEDAQGLHTEESKRVTGVQLLDTKTGEKTTIPVRAVFLAIGHTPNSALCKNCVAVKENGYIEVQGRTQKTSQAGIFAAGEVENDKYRQVDAARSAGADAGLDVRDFLTHIGYSSNVLERMKLWVPGLHGTGGVALETIESLADFEKKSQESQNLMVLDFSTVDCSACKQLEPLMEELAFAFDGKAQFFKVDAGQAQDLAEKYFVYKVPCLLLFKGGELRARYMPRPDQSGVVHKEEIQSLIDQAMSQDT